MMYHFWVTWRDPSDTTLCRRCGLIEMQDHILMESRFGDEQLTMRISKASRIFKSDDPGWYLLTEISLCEFLSNHEESNANKASILSQIAQETGIPTECAERIAMVATILAKEAPAHFQQGGVKNPAQMRIFCQNKFKDTTRSASGTSSAFHAEQPVEHARMIQDDVAIMSGGWGYFIIERSADNTGSDERRHPIVDLFLYKEGS